MSHNLDRIFTVETPRAITQNLTFHLRASGLVAEVTRAAPRGIPVLGVTRGMQILERAILDPGLMILASSKMVMPPAWVCWT